MSKTLVGTVSSHNERYCIDSYKRKLQTLKWALFLTGEIHENKIYNGLLSPAPALKNYLVQAIS
jgi:hypothetical protein